MKYTLIALAVAVSGLSAADKKIQMKDLPPAVQKTVQAEEAKGARIVGLAVEMEGGKKMYEVAVTAAGKPIKS